MVVVWGLGLEVRKDDCAKPMVLLLQGFCTWRQAHRISTDRNTLISHRSSFECSPEGEHEGHDPETSSHLVLQPN